MRSEFIVVLSVHVGNQVRYRVFKETVVYPRTFFGLWEHEKFYVVRSDLAVLRLKYQTWGNFLINGSSWPHSVCERNGNTIVILRELDF